MAFRWPLRILGLIGIIFLIQNMWSISLVRMEPLPVNPDMPSFSDVAKEIDPDYDENQFFRTGVWSGFGRIKDDCRPENMREFAGNVRTFYENAIGNARRAGVSRIEDAPGWSQEDTKIDNFVAALARAGMLRLEHFVRQENVAGSRIPLSVEGDIPHVYPDWAEPPLTLDCPRE
jgi:hypothetical protein